MLARRRQELEVLSISALDIFASALGVFILVAIILFPYYLKQPALETAAEGAAAELAAAQQSVAEVEAEMTLAEGRRLAAEAALAQARRQLETAQAEAAARAAAVAAQPIERPTVGEQQTPLSIPDLDLVFVMDTTGSMRHELRDIQANLVGIVRILHRLADSLRVGFVAFKDRDDDYLTQVFPLRSMERGHLAEIVRFVRSVGARGGGDDPEPVDVALDAALGMNWRPDAEGRIIVIGDARVHAHNHGRTMQQAMRFRRSRADAAHPRTVWTIFTGSSGDDRIFFQRLADAGGGDFSEHQEHMIESILLSVLPEAPGPGGTSGGSGR